MQARDNEPIYYLTKKMWQFAEGNKRRVVLYSFLSILGNAGWVSTPAVFGYLLNSIQKAQGINAGNIVEISLLIASLLVIDIISWLFHGSSRVIEQDCAFKITHAYRTYLMQGVFGLPIQWHGEHDSGDTISKISKATDGLLQFIRNSFQIIQVLVRVVITSVILFFFNPTVALVVLVLMVVSFFITLQFDKKIVPLFHSVQHIENRTMVKLTDALTNIFSVKILSIEKPIRSGILQSANSAFSDFHKEAVVNELKWGAGSLIFTMINIVPLLVYVFLSKVGHATFQVGTFTALYLYSTNLIFVYFNFNGSYEELMRNRARVANAASLEEAIVAYSSVERMPVVGWKHLSIKNLAFKYSSEHEKVHLDSISLDIARGEHIALIGSSGSGKTTFLKVLHGMYDTAEGAYAVDGGLYHQSSFADIDLSSTLVPQEPEVFSLTVRENITLGMDYSDDEIQHATDLAKFTGIIEELPQGLDSIINEKGVNLSGGQKQRLALARALLFGKHKELLLLDESTSSVDPESEARIYEGIKKDFTGKTVIASIHKLHLLSYFDRIIIFKGGSIQDDGTFQELLDRNQSFQKLWNAYNKTLS
jgi:ATP-binding cassette subfamily B protein